MYFQVRFFNEARLSGRSAAGIERTARTVRTILERELNRCHSVSGAHWTLCVNAANRIALLTHLSVGRYRMGISRMDASRMDASRMDAS